MIYVGYFGKRLAYDLAKAHARDKQAKKRAKQKAKEQAQKEQEKAKQRAEKERIKQLKEQEKARQQALKEQARQEKEEQARERAMLKANGIVTKLNNDMQQANDLIDYIRGKEELLDKYSDVEWITTQLQLKGFDKVVKPLHTIANKCDTLAKKLDNLNKYIIQLMEIRDKYNVSITLSFNGEWAEIYNKQMDFATTIKSGVLNIIECVEQLQDALDEN